MEKSELENLLKEGKITLKEYEDELDILNGKTKRDGKIKTYDVKHNDVSTEKELSDRELQEQILQTLKLNQEDNRTIKFWVVFWSWLSIISIILYIFILLTTLK